MKRILITIIVIMFVAGLILTLVTIVSSKDKNKKESKADNLVEYVTVDMTTEATEEQTTEDLVLSSYDDLMKDVDPLSDASVIDSVTANTNATSLDRYTVNQNTNDTKAPVFLINTKSVSIPRGTEFDVHSFVGYGDDVDRDVELTIDGTVNTSEVGRYSITINLKDDAGHVTSSDMTVNVNDSDIVADDDAPLPPGTESFSSFESGYRKEGTKLGIDVSRWQGDIDFNKVKAAGCDFVIMRIGGYDDKEHYIDRCYQNNIKNAKAAGLKVGIYWHSEESTPEEVKASVRYMLDVLDGEKLDFPIAYDWEDFVGFEDYKMNLQDLNDCFEVFCDEVEAAGYEACLYSSLNFLENVWVNSRDHKVWLAHYTSQTDYTGKYYMWQHSSSGMIDGASSAVDFNVLYE
ncbi:Glycosyl hydrolases family 25 [Lachnospiraceae bacterium]|nr:Glycosyl hydrolases family 25 [Lachnospiraceae bacterium]